MEKKIKIFTGKIHSGKTTKLFTFLNSLNSVDGILAPIINDRRMLYHISSKQIKILEVDSKSEETISVGDYNFLKECFSWANQKLIESFNKNYKWLIIDEIGKLELDKEGLFESADFILKNSQNSQTKIILVIRDYLVKSVLDFYKIDENEFEYIEI